MGSTLGTLNNKRHNPISYSFFENPHIKEKQEDLRKSYNFYVSIYEGPQNKRVSSFATTIYHSLSSITSILILIRILTNILNINYNKSI